MVKAQRIERDGTPHGSVKTFTNAKWDRMNTNYPGKNFRWVLVSETVEEKKQEVVDFPCKPEIPDDFVPFKGTDEVQSKLEQMTKKMMVMEYDLPDEDIKLSRQGLVNKIKFEVLNLKE